MIRDPHRILMMKDSATLESGRSSQMEAVKDRLKFWQTNAKREQNLSMLDRFTLI